MNARSITTALVFCGALAGLLFPGANVHAQENPPALPDSLFQRAHRVKIPDLR
jgi:hypothetical protein